VSEWFITGTEPGARGGGVDKGYNMYVNQCGTWMVDPTRIENKGASWGKSDARDWAIRAQRGQYVRSRRYGTLTTYFFGRSSWGGPIYVQGRCFAPSPTPSETPPGGSAEPTRKPRPTPTPEPTKDNGGGGNGGGGGGNGNGHGNGGGGGGTATAQAAAPAALDAQLTSAPARAAPTATVGTRVQDQLAATRLPWGARYALTVYAMVQAAALPETSQPVTLARRRSRPLTRRRR
jgi:hypothetical protein